jgi:hypothetical protein
MSDSEDSDGHTCKTACCANHICAKSMDLTNDVHVACALCLSPAAIYCSEACRQVDWIAHACSNAKMMDKPGKLVAVPYAYQDEAPEDVIASELENPLSPLRETYQLAHMGQDMVVSSWSVGEMARPYNVKPTLRGGDLGRGSVPSDDLKVLNYTIGISSLTGQTRTNTVTFAGNVGIDSIWLGNKQNSTANKIAQTNRLDKSTGTLLLWPKHGQKTEDRMFKNEGDFQVWLAIDGKQDVSIEFELLPIKPSFFGRLGRTLAKHFQTRLKLKFDATLKGKNKEANIKNMYVVQAKTQLGLQVTLVFIALPSQLGVVELADVEFSIPLNQIRAKATTGLEKTLTELGLTETEVKSDAFRCDPRQVEQMVGLSMALDLAIAKNAADKRIQNAAGLVRKQTRLLLEAPASASAAAESVPMDVSTAVHSAVNFLHDSHIAPGQ